MDKSSVHERSGGKINCAISKEGVLRGKKRGTNKI